jgi:hypothetical protein
MLTEVPLRTLDEPTEPGPYLVAGTLVVKWRHPNSDDRYSWMNAHGDIRIDFWSGLCRELGLGPDVTIRRMVGEVAVDEHALYRKILDLLGDDLSESDHDFAARVMGVIACTAWGPRTEPEPCSCDLADEERLRATFVRILQHRLIAGTIQSTTPSSAKDLAHELVQVVNERGRAHEIPERVSASAETPTPDRVDMITQVLAAHDIGVQLQRGKWAWVCHGRPNCGSASAYEHAWPNDALAAGRSHIAEQIDKALQLAAAIAWAARGEDGS